MEISITDIDASAEKIIHKMQLGELSEGCCLSAIQTPITEAWEMAKRLADNGELSHIIAKEIFSKLDQNVQSQLAASGYDDFDLIYERFLQKIKR